MKKLLSILAATGLVAISTTTVIACGNKKDDKGDDEQLVDVSQLIIDFKQEVDKIVTEHIKSREDALLVYIEQEGERKYKFFNKKNLESIWKEGEEKTKSIVEKWKPDILDDLNNILNINNPSTGLEQKINKLINAHDSKYSFILSNLPNGKVFDEVKLLDDKKITFDKMSNNDLYIANVRLSYEIGVWFKDLAGEPLLYKPDVNEFIMSISTHKGFLDAINKLNHSVKKEFALDKNSGEKWSNIRYDDLNLELDKKTQVEDLTREIEHLYTNKDHSELENFMKDKYFSELEKIKINKVSFKQNSDFNVTNPEWDINFREDNKFEAELTPVGEDKTSKLKDAFFNPERSSAQALDLIYRYDYNKGKGIKELEEFEKNHFSKTNSVFDSKLKEFLKKQDKDLKLEDSVFNTNKHELTRMTTIKIPEIEIRIGDSYVHPILNEIDLIIAYRPGNSTRDSAQIKKLYIENIVNAIAQFQNTYDIVPQERNQEKYEALGRMKKDSQILKQWENAGLNQITDFNQAYPLTNLIANPELQSLKTKLIINMKQKNFDYSIGGKEKQNWFWNRITTNEYVLDKIAGFGEKENLFEYWFEIDYFKIKLRYNWVNGEAKDKVKIISAN